jgi:hypothetical protein
MSHEWNCRCPRCETDEAKYTGPDPREQDEAARHAAGGTTETSEGEE